jgi:hypothetical protein
MADEFGHNNPRDLIEERFVRLEEKFIEISHNVPLLMVALVRKIKPFEEVGGLNSNIGSD